MLLQDKQTLLKFIQNAKLYVFYILVFFVAISKGVIEVSFGIIFFLWISEKILTKKGNLKEYFPKTALNLPIAVMIAIFFLTIFNSYAPALSLRKFFSKWAEFMMLYFFTVDIIDSKKKFKHALWVLSAAFTLVLIDGCWQVWAGKDFLYSYPLDGAERAWIRGCYSVLDAFGSVVILLAPVVIGFLFTFSHKIIVWLRAAIFSLSSVCLLLTCAVPSWIAMISSLALSSFFTKKKIVKIIPVLLILFMGALFLIPAFKVRLIPAFHASLYAENGRIAIWKENIQEIMVNPVLGKGVGTTCERIARKYSKLPLVLKANPHNRYLVIALEAGILGLIAYLWVLWRAVKVLFSSRRGLLWYGFFIGFFAFLIENAADNIWDERILCLFWIIVGFIAVHNRVAKLENK